MEQIPYKTNNKTMDILLKMCEKKDYQILIERVKPEGGPIEIEFVERETK